MILIFSSYMDTSTSVVADYISKLNHEFLRVNSFTDFKLRKITFGSGKDEFEINYKNRNININEINAIWYRRADSEIEGFIKDQSSNNLNKKIISQYNSFIKSEYSGLRNTVYFMLRDKYWLGNPYRGHINKIIQLKIAKKCGLKIPETIISGNKNEVLKFYKKNGNIISKPIKHIKHIDFQNEMLTMYTIEITQNMFNEMPISFLPSIFQKRINKKCELRVFFLEDDFYSICIDSQKSKQTKVDFRNIDKSNPNRRFPIKLSAPLKDKLFLIMKTLNLKTGSIDLIVSKKDEVFFLEVNPVGQFGMVSYPGGFNIHHKIATTLINNDKI